MDLMTICSFVLAFIFSLILVPIVGSISIKLGIIAHINERTIHKGVIARTGGYAIYIAFIICAAIFLKTDKQINSILIGGFIIFLTGLYDDIHDLSPKFKVLGQLLAALVVIFYGGISLKNFTLPILPSNISYIIAIIITLGWIVGITNAINLIDGLDGLCAGISIITLITISISSITTFRYDIASISLILAGATAGFLVYNFHPAKIFMGDCGALFLGYMISVISLLGYGYQTSTFFTLGAPITVLAVPMADTIVAIVRRKINHKHIDEADRGHLHHKLMFTLKLGQTKSVLILYFVTIVFSFTSLIYRRHPLRALGIVLLIMTIFEIFIELTDMISRQYKPILTLINIIIKSDKLPKIKESAPYKRFVKRNTIRLLIFTLTMSVIVGGLMTYRYYENNKNKKEVKIETLYNVSNNSTTLMNNVYKEINKRQNNVNSELAKYVSAYFVIDYYTLSNKETDQIGGINYFYKSRVSAFRKFALSNYYENVNTMIKNNNHDIEVVSYNIISAKRSKTTLAELEDYRYYDIRLKITFNKTNSILNKDDINVLVTVINKDNKISVVSFENLSENN